MLALSAGYQKNYNLTYGPRVTYGYLQYKHTAWCMTGTITICENQQFSSLWSLLVVIPTMPLILRCSTKTFLTVLTNEVGYITDIPWLLWIYRSKTTPSSSGCALGFRVVFDDKSLQPWYNYYISGQDKYVNIKPTTLLCIGN